MSIEITRKIKFCAGHRLMNHGGKCENLHGHNYLAEFTIAGTETDTVGRVIDFAVIKALFKGWIDEHWDHGFLVWDQDERVVDAMKAMNTKLFLLPMNPTAENMALYLLRDVGPQLLEQVREYQVELTRVAIWETEDSCAVAQAPGGVNHFPLPTAQRLRSPTTGNSVAGNSVTGSE